LYVVDPYLANYSFTQLFLCPGCTAAFPSVALLLVRRTALVLVGMSVFVVAGIVGWGHWPAVPELVFLAGALFV
jgi:hypothetical protein